MATRADGLDLSGGLRCAGCLKRGVALCPACARRLDMPPAGQAGPLRVLAGWPYAHAARALVLELKAGGRRAAAEPLAARMCAAARRYGLAGEIITWVPGRRRDVRARGYDHAEVLARDVGGGLGLPVQALLTLARPRPDQVGLDAHGRRANLEGSFRGARCSGAVVLVDDVLTTGATAAACAAALESAGASSVEALVGCRA